MRSSRVAQSERGVRVTSKVKNRGLGKFQNVSVSVFSVPWSMMSELTDLYQEVILDHNRRPHNFRVIDGATAKQEGYNPLCGDRLTLYLTLEGDVIKDAAFQGQGCAISKASASLMTDAIKGKTVAEARDLFEHFHAMITSDTDTPAGRHGQAVGAGRRPRISHAHQVRQPGVAHHEGGGRARDRRAGIH